MELIWQGPGVLWGTGDPIYPGQPIPDGHVTPERIDELGDRVKTVKPEPSPSTTSDSEFDPQLDPPPKRGPGRPPGKKNK